MTSVLVRPALPVRVVNDVMHLILLVKQRDMTANGGVPVAGRRRRELALEIGGHRMDQFLEVPTQRGAYLQPRLLIGRQSILRSEPDWGMGLVATVPVAGGLSVLGVELRLAMAILISPCLPAGLRVPGLRASRRREHQQCDDTGRDVTYGHVLLQSE
jgi:hypothetical protein